MFKNLQEDVLEMIGLLKNEDSFLEGKKRLLELRIMMKDAYLGLRDGLKDDDFSKMPFPNNEGFESKTLAYSIYHVFRIEDIVVNPLATNQEEVITSDDFQKRLNSKIKTSGNELTSDEIVSFSKELNIDELMNYLETVVNKTDQWLEGLSYKDLFMKFGEVEVKRLRSLNVVHETMLRQIDFWCSLDVLGMIGMPLSKHWTIHLIPCYQIKEELKKS